MYRKELTLKFRAGNYVEDNNGNFGQFVPDHQLEYMVDMDNNSCESVFEHIKSFLKGMGALDVEIVRGACGIAFSPGYDETTRNLVREIGEFTPNNEVEERIETEVGIQVGSYMQVDRLQDRQTWENRYWDLQKEYQEKMLEMKAKISRLENPDEEDFTLEEKHHLEWHAQQNNGVLNVVNAVDEPSEEVVEEKETSPHVVQAGDDVLSPEEFDRQYEAHYDEMYPQEETERQPFELDHKHSY